MILQNPWLCASVHIRTHAVLKANSGHTKYWLLFTHVAFCKLAIVFLFCFFKCYILKAFFFSDILHTCLFHSAAYSSHFILAAASWAYFSWHEFSHTPDGNLDVSKWDLSKKNLQNLHIDKGEGDFKIMEGLSLCPSSDAICLVQMSWLNTAHQAKEVCV